MDESSGPLTLSELGTTTTALSSTGGAPKLEEIAQEIKTTSSARKNRQRRKSIKRQSEASFEQSTDLLKIDKSYIDTLRARLDPPLPPISPSPVLEQQNETKEEKENEVPQQNDERPKERRKKRKRTQPVPDPALIELPPSSDSPHSMENLIEGSELQNESTRPVSLTLQRLQRPSNDPLLLVDDEDIRETRRQSIILPSTKQNITSNDEVHHHHHRRNTVYQQQPDTRAFVRTHIKHSTSHDHHHHGNHHHGNHSESKLGGKDSYISGGIRKEYSLYTSGTNTEKEGEEDREMMIEKVLTNGDFVLIFHQYIKLFIMAAHGITAGISLWDTVLTYILASNHNHSILLLYYHSFPLGLHALYLLVTSAIIITLLDRFDIANMTIPCIKSCCHPKDLALAVALVLLVVGVLSISTSAFLDSRIALFTKEPSLWSDIISAINSTSTTTINTLFTSSSTGMRYTTLTSSTSSSYVTGWLVLSIIRTITLCLSWCIINITMYNHYDRIEEHIKELDKQLHHHHTTHSTSVHHVQRNSV